MYAGYLAIGGESLMDPSFELLNNGRVAAYVANWNRKMRQSKRAVDAAQCIDWFQGCDTCPSVDAVFTNGQGYILPELDPAPWYSPTVRDSDKFFGVMALEVTGQDDSTRSATVQPSVTGGGAVSRLRFGPRTLVVRGLAVAADDCGMEVGLNFLRCQYETTLDECGRDLLWFLSCCPDCQTNPNSPPVGPCWASNYGELGPSSPPAECPPGTWWPETYADLLTGPPDTTQWCAWVDTYRELRQGLPEFSCDVAQCLSPALRNFQGVRVISGPTVLSRRSMSGTGEIAEIEFTIACADPALYTPIEIQGFAQFDAGEPWVDPDPVVVVVDPFDPAPPPAPAPPPSQISLPAQWKRSTYTFTPKRRTDLEQFIPAITVAAEEDMGLVRVGVWRDDEHIGGFVLPFVPAEGIVKLNAIAKHTITEHAGKGKKRNGFAKSFHGGPFVKWPEMTPGQQYTITIDQEVDKAVSFAMELAGAEKGCA